MAGNQGFIFEKVDLSQEIIDLLTQLILHGEVSSHTNYYKPHSKGNITLVVLEIHQLRARLLHKDEINYTEPQMTREVKNYEQKQHLGHNIYICPQHVKLMEDLDKDVTDDELKERKVNVGIMLVKNGGCITFHLN